MGIADFLNFIGIIVSIILGFFVSHYHSIKDTRTRALKDYYIEEVKDLKKRVDSFFHDISFGESSFSEVVDWYGHMIIDEKGIEDGVRKSFDLQIGRVADILDRYYGEITNWDDYNDQYSYPKYTPTNEHRHRLSQMKYEMDVFLNDYLSHINHANNYPIWKTQYRRIKQSYSFYRDEGRESPFLLSVWERIEKHFWEILFAIALLFAVVFLVKNIKMEKKNELVAPLINIANTQDSIYKEVKILRDKYKPIEMHSKTFNNSSFFNAEKIDSVQIRLYQGHLKD